MKTNSFYPATDYTDGNILVIFVAVADAVRGVADDGDDDDDDDVSVITVLL